MNDINKTFIFDHNGKLIQRNSLQFKADNLPGLFKRGFRFSLNQGSKTKRNEKREKVRKSVDYTKYFKHIERIPSNFKKEGNEQNRMVTNSSIDLHKDVRMQTAAGGRLGTTGFEPTLNDSSLMNDTMKMSRKYYNDTFNQPNFFTRIIPFHNMDNIKVNEKGNDTLLTEDVHQILLNTNNEAQTGHVTHRSEIAEKVSQYKNRRNTTSVRRRIRNHPKNMVNSIVRGGKSDFSILVDSESHQNLRAVNASFETTLKSKPISRMLHTRKYGVLADRLSNITRRTSKIHTFIDKAQAIKN
mmetsp:Transcript_11500/g.10167  ORF Transcript_11500/g.10167 Transcript_11500/m.10167 type:complete len:299 (+) Transcript_11500:631-1527(+)